MAKKKRRATAAKATGKKTKRAVKKAPAKKAAAKRASTRKAANKNKRKTSKKTSAKKVARKTVTRKKTPGKKSSRKKSARPAQGRPKVTGEEKLYMLFREDYHARQIFEFLGVETVRELEQYSPGEIVKLLSKPIRQTVDGIRKQLADKNRHLNEDAPFAIEHQTRQREK